MPVEVGTVATKGQAVVDWAESQLGVHESPNGSNCGGCQKYQAYYPWGLGRCSDGREGNWPWCGSFVGAAWAAIVPGSEDYSDPSTATMCNSKPNVSAQPGAAGVICGTHTFLLRYRISGSTWACIGGNESNQVGFSTRDISGCQIVGPPWLGEGDAGAPEPETKWYFLQDTRAVSSTGQHAYYGGWATQDARDNVYADLKADLGHEIRKFKDGDWDSPYFLDNSAFVDEIYGGWSSEGARDNARDTLEDRLGYALRPFSEMRTAAQGGVPWACKNLA